MSDLDRMPGESLGDYVRRKLNVERISEAAQKVQTFEEDLVPAIETTRSQESLEIDAVLGGIDIVDAYNRWCGKMHVDPKGKTESIMVSCPNPAHPDKHPSAWMSTEKGDGGVGTCAQCGGFDKYDIAAWKFGFDVPGYKSKEDFPALRRQMAEDLGYQVVVAGKDEWLVKSQPNDQQAATLAAVPDPSGPSSDVEPAEPNLPSSFDWRELSINQNTFLNEWLNVTSTLYEPEEFYLFEGFMALAAACGNHATLMDDRPVRPNLLVCLTGTTGAGKSNAIDALLQVVRTAMPWDYATSGGVRMVGSAGSGEALIDQFVNRVTDVSTGTTMEMPVNGLIEEDEFAALAKRMARNGSTIREVLMKLFDRKSDFTLVSRGAGEVTARNHFLQLVTSTQPESLRSLMSNNDATSGFLNRWIYVFGTEKHRPSIIKRNLDLSNSVDLLRRVRTWAHSGKVVDFHDPDVFLAWEEWFQDDVMPHRRKEGAFMFARIDLLAKKLALLFAINDRSTTITMDHVENVKRMWPYILRCYSMVDQRVGQDDLTAIMDELEKYMGSRPNDTFTLRQLMKQSGARKFGRDQVSKAVDILTRMGVMQEVPRAKNDRVPRFTFHAEDTPPISLSVVRNGSA